jgi:hypothetical protein
MTVEGVQKLFKVTMSTQEPFISKALGGNDTAAYQQFYSRKRKQYWTCTQKDMTTLTGVVKKAATANATALGVTLTALLQGFAAQWTDTKKAQVLQKGKLSTGRVTRKNTRTMLEKDLCTALFMVGINAPGEMKKCKSLVNLSLLHNHTHHKHIKKSGSLKIYEEVIRVNKTFSAKDKIKVINTSTNAVLKVYLLKNKEEEPILFAKIKPQKSMIKLASKLGSLEGTLLVIKNMSLENMASYVLDYIE